MGAAVIANLHGGLGNQLFQVAAALHAARAIGAPADDLLLLDTSRGTVGVADLADLAHVEVRVPTRLDRARWTEHARDHSPLTMAFRPTARVNERLTRRWLIRQTSPFDEPPVLEPGRPVKLEGYFQHPAWYADVWRDVVALLLAAAPAGFEELRSRRRTVVHVRRRDYVDAGWAMGPAYYLECMAALRVGDRDVVVVCDEPGFATWFAEAVGLDGRVATAERLVGDTVIDDFWNLAAASTVIMANSTFSWWATAVASTIDPGIQVAYPSPWIVNQWNHEPLPDLGLPGWTLFASGLPAFR